jgi:outer membrane protein OmpA-like peptidoglycan-associated protein
MGGQPGFPQGAQQVFPQPNAPSGFPQAPQGGFPQDPSAGQQHFAAQQQPYPPAAPQGFPQAPQQALPAAQQPAVAPQQGYPPAAQQGLPQQSFPQAPQQALPAAQQPSYPPPPAPQGTPQAVPQQPAVTAQPPMTEIKSTFIPGEKTLFFDDFTDMSPDDAPPHFKVRGAAPQLLAGGGVRQLTARAKGSLFPNLKTLPKNFTYEAEIKVDVPKGRADANLILVSKGKQILHWWLSAQAKQLDLVVSLKAPYQELGRKRVAVNTDQPMKVALWVQNGRMRSFVNGEKLLDFNQVDLPPIDSIEMEQSFLGAGPALGYRMVRFAESTPDFSQVISATGRYVTYGILFDTDSDRLKPESAPVIQTIARGLEANPNLQLLIEGHTDSVGDAAHNLDLSRRRAEALKTVLVTQFRIDANRLTTAGLGATKPIDSNDTPKGRAQNRRVELVKR